MAPDGHLMQGIGFAIVGTISAVAEMAQRKVLGEPKKCRDCGGPLVLDNEPRPFADGPAYYCLHASSAQGARMVRGYTVIDCDR